MDGTSALEKLAGELIERIDALEQENALLRKQASAAEADADGLRKAASAAVSAGAVSEQTAEATVQALYKAGSLTAGQLEESRRILLSDAEAPHRILQKMLDDACQVKTASAGPDDNVSGGTLAGPGAGMREDRQADCLDRMMRILRME